MESCTLLVEGGNALKGNLRVQGAKNSALFLLAAALLTDQPVILQNVPLLPDMDILYQIVEELGVYVGWNPSERCVCIEAKAIEHASVNATLARKLRASVALACPLLYRCKRCRIPFPGGDPIGKRPLDEMMRGIAILGGEVHTEAGWYDLRLARDLQGASIHLRYPSHTATMALMMLGAVARGTTIIYNAAQEPEVTGGITDL